MPHLVSVDVVQSIEQHLHDLLDLCQGELYIGIAEQPSQVMLTEVKHQVDAAFVSVELSSFKNNGRIILCNICFLLPSLEQDTFCYFLHGRTDKCPKYTTTQS